MDALTKYDIPVILEAPEVLKIAQELKKEPAQVRAETSYHLHLPKCPGCSLAFLTSSM